MPRRAPRLFLTLQEAAREMSMRDADAYALLERRGLSQRVGSKLMVCVSALERAHAEGKLDPNWTSPDQPPKALDSNLIILADI